jgi:hypothetical protein
MSNKETLEEFRKIASKELLEKFDTDCLKYSEDGDSDNYFYANCKYWESKLKEEHKQALEMESEKNQKYDEMLEMLEKCEYFIRASNQYSELGKKVEQLIKEASKI